MPPQQPNPDKLIDRIQRFAKTFPAVVRTFAPEDTKWKPDDQSWSVLEIVCHMADEEQEDFRTRVLSTLNDPEAEWPPIDPEGWAIAREYQSQDLDSQLSRWIAERDLSINQLQNLQSPDWSRAKIHPRFGPMTAIGLLAAWCAHDALHLRQLAKRMHQLAIRDANNDPTIQYAGQW